jgi:pimeloyl-ACP methyl ester carboxylesterase
MSVVILRDEIVHYEVLGRGRPVVFLHDWVGSWRYWIPSMQSASISYRAYALDQWGFGDSGRNPLYYTLEQQAGLLGEFLEELGVAKIALVGHGMGALVGLIYARRAPAAVDRALLISLPLGETALNPRLRTAPPTELADWLLGRSPATEPAWAEAPKADPRALSLALASLQNVEVEALLAGLAAPHLLVHGSSDPAVNQFSAERQAALPEQAHYLVFDNCGHYPMLDEPSKFNRLAADFLSLGSGVSPRQLQLKEEWKRRVR